MTAELYPDTYAADQPAKEAAVARRIAGAAYDTAGLLQPGCTICGETLPESKAKRRAQLCSDACINRVRALKHAGKLFSTVRRCQVCRGSIPLPRHEYPRLRQICSTSCWNELRRYRWQILKQGKCPACYHPCTPEEWESWRQWRASNGPMQGFIALPGRGRPAQVKALRVTLKAAAELLRRELALIIAANATEWMEGQPVRSSLTLDGATFVEPMEKVLDQAEALLAPAKRPLTQTAAVRVDCKASDAPKANTR
jgi:hypothetical protein